MAVTAEDAFYIKLGRRGEWEAECLKDGTLHFGYRETPHDLCLAGAWAEVKDFWADRRGDVGTATRDMKQIRAFYEADETTLFITNASRPRAARNASRREAVPPGCAMTPRSRTSISAQHAVSTVISS